MESKVRYRAHGLICGSIILILALAIFPSRGSCKSYIESCFTNDLCNAMVSYKLSSEMNISSIASLFSVDAISLFGANNFEFKTFDPDQVIISAHQILKVPVSCACSSGIRRTSSIVYTVKAQDTLLVIASTFGGMITPQQIVQANNLPNAPNISAGQSLIIPFPCACRNNIYDDHLTIFLTYTVQSEDSVSQLASSFGITQQEFLSLNTMQSPSSLLAGDVVVLPIRACTSSFSPHAIDYGLTVANGSYVLTAEHCVQCSCAYNFPKVYCTPAPPTLSASCPAIKCGETDLTVGEYSTSQALSGCYILTCLYNGYNRSGILVSLQASNATICPVAPPVTNYRPLGPSSAPFVAPGPQSLLPTSTSAGNLGAASSAPRMAPASATLLFSFLVAPKFIRDLFYLL